MMNANPPDTSTWVGQRDNWDFATRSRQCEVLRKQAFIDDAELGAEHGPIRLENLKHRSRYGGPAHHECLSSPVEDGLGNRSSQSTSD